MEAEQALSRDLRSDIRHFAAISIHFQLECLALQNAGLLLAQEERELIERAVRGCMTWNEALQRNDHGSAEEYDELLNAACFSAWLLLPECLTLDGTWSLLADCEDALDARYGAGTVHSPLWEELWPDELPYYPRRELHAWLVELGVNLERRTGFMRRPVC